MDRPTWRRHSRGHLGSDVHHELRTLAGPDARLFKGGGGANTREKSVAAAADRFVVIADSTKPVHALHSPIPLELLSFGLRATLRRVAPASLRDVPLSPDGGVIADYRGP